MKYAELDNKNHLVGYADNATGLTNYVAVPDGTDLPPDGTYYYDAAGQRFMPVIDDLALPVSPGAPSAAAALADIIRAVQASGVPGPGSLDWLAWYEATVDGNPNLQGGSQT